MTVKQTLRLAPLLLFVMLGTQGCVAAIFPAMSALGGLFSVASYVERQSHYAKPQPAAAIDAGTGTSSDAEAYRRGIRDTLEKLQRHGGLPVVASPQQPEPHHYIGPVMQEVWVPAQVVGGMVIPAHRTWVLVRPGMWQTPGAGAPRPVAAPGAAVPAAHGGKQGPF